MILEMLWNDNPPITKALFIAMFSISLTIYIEGDLENQVLLLRGKQLDIWRYFTNVLYSGKFSMGFFIKFCIK